MTVRVGGMGLVVVEVGSGWRVGRRVYGSEIAILAAEPPKAGRRPVACPASTLQPPLRRANPRCAASHRAALRPGLAPSRRHACGARVAERLSVGERAEAARLSDGE